MAGRKSKYETHVEPHLEHIRAWVVSMTEAQIAERLGISEQSLNTYKREHPELMEAIVQGRQDLTTGLKDALRKKAFGYTYTETKTVIRREGDKEIRYIEKYEKVAHPDTGAIHLLLKNIDDNWHNDDSRILELKEMELELRRTKMEQEEWQ